MGISPDLWRRSYLGRRPRLRTPICAVVFCICLAVLIVGSGLSAARASAATASASFARTSSVTPTVTHSSNTTTTFPTSATVTYNGYQSLCDGGTCNVYAGYGADITMVLTPRDGVCAPTYCSYAMSSVSGMLFGNTAPLDGAYDGVPCSVAITPAIEQYLFTPISNGSGSIELTTDLGGPSGNGSGGTGGFDLFVESVPPELSYCDAGANLGTAAQGPYVSDYPQPWSPGTKSSTWPSNGVTGSYQITWTYDNTGPPQYALSVSKAGSGSGTVTSADGGIDCGGTCSDSYASGTMVTLTATPDDGSTFVGWSGSGCSGTGTCTVTMSSDQGVSATFATTSLPPHTLSVSGSGSGSVTSSPTGISCPGACSHSYANGTTVTLTATPAAGSTFAGWSGSGCSGTGTCMVTMSSDQGVTATFSALPCYQSTVTEYAGIPVTQPHAFVDLVLVSWCVDASGGIHISSASQHPGVESLPISNELGFSFEVTPRPAPAPTIAGNVVHAKGLVFYEQWDLGTLFGFIPKIVASVVTEGAESALAQIIRTGRWGLLPIELFKLYGKLNTRIYAIAAKHLGLPPAATDWLKDKLKSRADPFVNRLEAKLRKLGVNATPADVRRALRSGIDEFANALVLKNTDWVPQIAVVVGARKIPYVTDAGTQVSPGIKVHRPPIVDTYPAN